MAPCLSPSPSFLSLTVTHTRTHCSFSPLFFVCFFTSTFYYSEGLIICTGDFTASCVNIFTPIATIMPSTTSRLVFYFFPASCVNIFTWVLAVPGRPRIYPGWVLAQSQSSFAGFQSSLGVVLVRSWTCPSELHKHFYLGPSRPRI
jgi:hypothetical protein